MLTPFATTDSATITRQELADRLGPGAAAHLATLGLIADADGDAVTVRDAEMLNLIEGLIDVGVSLERLVAALAEIDAHQHAIAEAILRPYAEDVWEAFVSSKFAAPDWDSLAENAARAPARHQVAVPDAAGRTRRSRAGRHAARGRPDRTRAERPQTGSTRILRGSPTAWRAG